MTNPHKKYPEGMLRLIIQEISKTVKTNDLEQIYSYQITDDIDDVLKKFGITNVDWEDYSFWAKLVLDNENKTEDEPLEIPKPKKYDVYVEIDASKRYTETWVQKYWSYDEAMTYDMVREDPDFDYYSGDLYDDDIYDTETNDWDIKKIVPSHIQESMKKKNPILENKGSKIREIKQLQKMKILIEERLRILES